MELLAPSELGSEKEVCLYSPSGQALDQDAEPVQSCKRFQEAPLVSPHGRVVRLGEHRLGERSHRWMHRFAAERISASASWVVRKATVAPA